VAVLIVAVLVVVVVIGWPKVLHLVDATAFRAALYGTVAGDGKPDGVVRVSGATGAAKVPILVNKVSWQVRYVRRGSVNVTALDWRGVEVEEEGWRREGNIPLFTKGLNDNGVLHGSYSKLSHVSI